MSYYLFILQGVRLFNGTKQASVFGAGFDLAFVARFPNAFSCRYARYRFLFLVLFLLELLLNICSGNMPNSFRIS